MVTKIVAICDKNKWSAKIQALGEDWFGEGSHPAMPYHFAWLKDGRMFDMNWKFREIPTDHYKNRDCKYFNSPVDIPIEYFEMMVDRRKYGTLNVLLYPILQPLNFNLPGAHCSEAINDDLWFHGYRTPFFPYGAPPDPAAMLYWLEKLPGAT